ncbi:MAG TPA: APC family permease [Anaerolineae bacterium]|nr:APC family permease [Anaerolineae bacterium]
MLDRVKHLLIGPPLPTQQLGERKLNKLRALAAFSPDALSSIAYANQEIYLGLVVAGSAGLALSLPIGLAIATLLVIVALSHFQTIHGYPSGGGSYIVARSNLGTLPGLIAATALLIDYILTAAVSLTAGVAAIASAFPALWPHRVLLAVVLLGILAVLNLRGLRETGTVMAVPVYLFLLTFFATLILGSLKLFAEGPGSLASAAPPPAQTLTAFLVIHTFATGCTALTGIEAISNGVPAFRPPEAKNAGRTLIVMAVLMGLLFVGSIGLTQSLAVVAGPEETILSALTRSILGRGPAYLLVQVTTMLILAVAANTSFADFPRVAALLAADGFLPRQFTGLGDRLVFANGIFALSAAAAFLIVVFGGDTHALVPLFAVGAFLAFTLSQTGMVVHWRREQAGHWRLKLLANGGGALVTGVALMIIGTSKFAEGAWITIAVIPITVAIFLKIHAHYDEVRKELSLRGLPPSIKPFPQPRIVVPISGVHRGMVDAIAFAQSVSKDVTAVYIEMEPGSGERIRETWKHWWPNVPLVILPSPYRSLVGPLLDFLDQTDREHNDGQLATVVLPEFVPARWWHGLLHNQSGWLIKVALLYNRRRLGFQRAIIDVPYHLRR